jgi:hypothetical protein
MCWPTVHGGSSKMLGRRPLKRTRRFGRKATDGWGYHSLLGSARRWFEEDAEDARAWLLNRGFVAD